ncbi:PTS sugar transporter subunit IIB [Paenibacillus sanguinis]|uniref:PTS sugar transporter subunit IIB n=1 Tax=Paenibacillus sanguinis TaxID=225906 RepID=UPI000477A046|nr:PTS sugar transporter subunit IIB [Paenibacillus sanguinis]
MYKVLVACRAGVGSSLMLKIKIQQVIKENNFPIEVEHGSLDALQGFHGDAVITLIDVAEELRRKNLKIGVIGIHNIIDRQEIKAALEQFLASKVG